MAHLPFAYAAGLKWRFPLNRSIPGVIVDGDAKTVVVFRFLGGEQITMFNRGPYWETNDVPTRIAYLEL